MQLASSERVKARRATTTAHGRGGQAAAGAAWSWEGMRQRMGLMGPLQKDGGTRPQTWPQAGGAQLHGEAQQDPLQQRGSPGISKASLGGPERHTGQQRGASPALMLTEGLLWLLRLGWSREVQRGAGGPAG